MAKRKTKNKKRSQLKTFLLLLPVALVLIGLPIAYVVFSESPERMLPFLYEEIYSSGKLNRFINRIDASLYEALYKSGVQEKDVFFLNVHHMHQDGQVWDYAELLVRCADKQAARKLRRVIERDVASPGRGISLRTETDSQGSISCYISRKVRDTHKIILSVNGRRPFIKNTPPRVAIIIDDLGYDLDLDDAFLQLDLALTYSILPHGPCTTEIVRKVHQKRGELILHLPMEPKNYPTVSPGPGGLFRSMTDEEIRQVLSQDLLQIRGARGVNNHMGSSFTEDREKMQVVLNNLRKRGLFFVDSRTTKNTVAFDLARELGVLTAKRRVFLDNNLDAQALKIQMERLLNLARHQGEAIGIGHPYKETYQLIKNYREKLKNEFKIVPVSELVG